jgi:cobalt-zinc-cadmium efflux system outer membrane protein
MMRNPWAALAVALLSPGAALGTVLTLDDALERARREAPALLVARLRPEEARGRLAGASALLRDNPVIEATGGRRDGDRGASAEVDAGISQAFELGGRRRSRIAGAEAQVERETANVEDTTRQLLAEVAGGFLRALAAGERLRVLRANEQVAADLLRAAERRHHAGDVADLEVNVTRVAAWRARADLRAAEAGRQRALGELRAILGMDAGEPLEVRGDLRVRPMRPLDELLVSAAARADLRALAGEARAADAEARLGDGFTWPDLGIRFGYLRDEGDDVPLAGLSVSLPVFARGQELRVAGAARARRLRLELEARRRAIEVEVRAAFAAYERLAEATEALERHALPLLDDNDALARRSYEAGELGLADYLVLRRETLGARVEYLERALAAALAAIEVEARAGVLR